MPIPKQFKDNYKNEEEFTDNFLVPLFRRMGFETVQNYHGTREFGKDLILGEIDQFGEARYHGLQAKYVGSISQKDSHGLVRDCEEAFTHEFEHPATGEKKRISTFFAVNGGSISEQARANFFNTVQTKYGANMRLLDGKALIDLDRTAAMRRADYVMDLLRGLELECMSNLHTLDVILGRLQSYVQDQSNPLPIERFRTLALGAFLARPANLAGLTIDLVHNAWDFCELANKVLDNANGLTIVPNRVSYAQNVIANEKDIRTYIERVRDGVGEVAKSLQPLSGI